MTSSASCGVHLLHELVSRPWTLSTSRLVKSEFTSNPSSGSYSNGKVASPSTLKGSERKTDDMVSERGFKETLVITSEGWSTEETDWKDRLWTETEGELDGNKKVLEFALLGGDGAVSTLGTLISLWQKASFGIALVAANPFFIVAGVRAAPHATLNRRRNCICPTATPVPLVKLSMTVFQWLLSDLKTVLSNGLVQLLVWLGSSTTIISFCFANSTNSTLLCEPWPSQIRTCGRAGPTFFKKVSVNQSLAMPSLVHPESDTEKFDPLKDYCL